MFEMCSELRNTQAVHGMFSAESVLSRRDKFVDQWDDSKEKGALEASTFAEFESVVHKQLGTTGLMMFMKFGHSCPWGEKAMAGSLDVYCDKM
jgi:hypothetical protein